MTIWNRARLRQQQGVRKLSVFAPVGAEPTVRVFGDLTCTGPYPDIVCRSCGYAQCAQSCPTRVKPEQKPMGYSVLTEDCDCCGTPRSLGHADDCYFCREPSEQKPMRSLRAYPGWTLLPQGGSWEHASGAAVGRHVPRFAWRTAQGMTADLSLWKDTLEEAMCAALGIDVRASKTGPGFSAWGIAQRSAPIFETALDAARAALRAGAP